MAEKLIHLPIEEARAAKWRRGREQYGPVFIGHPLEELDEELLDAMNYAEEAARRGFPMAGIPETFGTSANEPAPSIARRRASWQKVRAGKGDRYGCKFSEEASGATFQERRIGQSRWEATRRTEPNDTCGSGTLERRSGEVDAQVCGVGLEWRLNSTSALHGAIGATAEGSPD